MTAAPVNPTTTSCSVMNLIPVLALQRPGEEDAMATAISIVTPSLTLRQHVARDTSANEPEDKLSPTDEYTPVFGEDKEDAMTAATAIASATVPAPLTPSQ